MRCPLWDVWCGVSSRRCLGVRHPLWGAWYGVSCVGCLLWGILCGVWGERCLLWDVWCGVSSVLALQVSSLFRGRVEERKLTLKVTAPADSEGVLRGDPNRLRQVSALDVP